MVKQKGINAWKPVKLEGAITAESVEGLIGIEELSDYDLGSVLKSSKAQTKKRKLSNSEPTEVKEPKKKQVRPETKKNKKQEIDISNNEPGAFVRNPNSPVKNEKQIEANKKQPKAKDEIKNQSTTHKKQQKVKNKNAQNSKKDVNKKQEGKTKENDGESTKITKKRKVEIGEIVENADRDTEKCSIADLGAWSNLPLAEPLLQALADLRFTKPTQIQELTLAPAILGRRDILGAAETGSGKTLAFGLPILAGILNLKEKAKKDTITSNEEQADSEDDIASDAEISAEDENESLEEESDADENIEESVQEDSAVEQVEVDDDDEDDSENDNQETSEESDFEENEEEVDNVNENGIGCVRSINNVDLNESITAKPQKPLYALILTPTRELAVQVKNHLIALAKHTDIRIAVVLGGMAAVKQERLLSKGPEIVVATPGRLWELIQQGNPHLSQVDNIRYLAIDETDRMIEKYHFQELHHLLERLNMDEIKRMTRQNFVFSATLTTVHDLPRHLLKKKKMKKARKSSKIAKMTPAQKLQQIIEMLGIHNPKVVDVTQQSGTAKSLTECRINCAIEEKDYYVYYFLTRHPGRTLIFCNSIGCVKRLATLLSLLGCSSLPLHASMQQRQRLKNLERFRDDPLGVLVATDVAARGLDIPKVEHVLHYQTPRTSESYIHRSGRTARASEEGITVMLIEPNEVGDYVKVCRTLGRSEDIPRFPVFEKMLVAVRQRVNLARQLDKLELQARRTNSECGWLQKAANDMDIILDEDEFAVSKNEKEAAKLKRQISAIRKQLSTNLVKPIMPRGFSAKYPTSSGELNIPLVQGDQSTKKALDVMKTAMEDGKKLKKKTRKLFKAKDRIKAANKADKINGSKLNIPNKKNKNNFVNKRNKNKQKRRK